MAVAVTFDAVILCGGSARRLGGADKASVSLGGVTFLERAAQAAVDAQRTIAVGPQRPAPTGLLWTIEDPPGGGPVAALGAGMELVREDLVAVLGVDFPFLEPETIRQLITQLGDADGAILADHEGRHQFLVGVYRSAKMRDALDRTPNGDRAMRHLIESLDLQVIEDPRAATDCDTWDEVRAAEAALRDV